MRKIALVAVLFVFAATTISVGTAHALAQNNVAAITSKGNLFEAPKTAKKATVRQATKSTNQAVTDSAPSTPAPVIVTVQSGDSLSSIAMANNTTYVRIFDANESLANPDVIHVGQQLRIPTADEQLPDRMPAVVTTAAVTTTTTTPRATTAHVSYPAVSGSSAKAFIYARESGNNPNATNGSGCYGLGQDCNGVVRNLCGANYACQDAYFTRYAMSRYGSWENAQAFWLQHHWW